MEPKKVLIELIEAYAAAVKSENETLRRMSTEALSNYLQSVDVTKIQLTEAIDE